MLLWLSKQVGRKMRSMKSRPARAILHTASTTPRGTEPAIPSDYVYVDSILALLRVTLVRIPLLPLISRAHHDHTQIRSFFTKISMKTNVITD
jgi:hypothetical protein